MSNERDNLDNFSLKSILAEVKGSAFINSEKKTPPDLLEEKADRILREAAEIISREESQKPAPDTAAEERYEEAAKAYQKTQSIRLAEPDFSDTEEIPMALTPSEDEPQKKIIEVPLTSFGTALDEATLKERNRSESDPFVIPLDSQSDSSLGAQQTKRFEGHTLFDQFNAQDDSATMVHEINIEDGSTALPEEDVKTSRWSGLFGKAKNLTGAEQSYINEAEQIFEEPRLRDAALKFARTCNSISLRCIPAAVITLLMISITYVFEAGLIVPFGIGRNIDYAIGAMLIGLLAVMMLCADIIIRGVDFLVKGAPNAETLILFSCVFSVLSSLFTMISDTALLLPFSAVSALSLVFATYGEKVNLRALTDTLKTAMGSAEPYGVLAEHNSDIDKSVLKKAYNRTDGFYNNLMQPDITEMVYRYAAPVLLIAALLLTILTALVQGGVENSLHIMSAMLAAAAPFSALLSFSIPFATVAKSVRRSGAALAGWGGSDDICYTDGVCVTDDDLFPPGTLRLSGVKVYDGASSDAAIRNTASLIISSGSGLTSLFSEVLKQQGLSADNVEDFEYHESGIGAVIKGQKVATGSAAYMNLLGVRVPDDSNMKNAVYTAINNRLVAMFAIDYKPLPSVQSALISMLKWRIDLFFAMRDFNVTPSMVGQKFKVPFESFVFIPAKDSYSISDPYSDKQGRMASVLVREGLGPFAEAITSGRLLKAASLFATILSVASAALGVFIMFLLSWNTAFAAGSPGNLIIFMLCMLATVLIICGYVRLKK
ncbi:MAG: hypothetical protein FWC20_08190 [Oscillospiraceae bacterium]|nr:hypothetical protein [Oscillospiraceae bacterium]MCL2279365.1 hypothetical protein [Oscillospiraceae bacterium]